MRIIDSSRTKDFIGMLSNAGENMEEMYLRGRDIDVLNQFVEDSLLPVLGRLTGFRRLSELSADDAGVDPTRWIKLIDDFRASLPDPFVQYLQMQRSTFKFTQPVLIKSFSIDFSTFVGTDGSWLLVESACHAHNEGASIKYFADVVELCAYVKVTFGSWRSYSGSRTLSFYGSRDPRLPHGLLPRPYAIDLLLGFEEVLDRNVLFGNVGVTSSYSELVYGILSNITFW